MDFFEHQEQARKKSHVLVFYFLLAVIGIIASLYLVGVVITGFIARNGGNSTIDLWQPELLLGTAVGSLAVIFLGSGYKTMQLSGGGKVVARELGGRRIDPNSIDFHEQRLMNVVEEMAIASGVPVPEVYVMDDEDSINAFAAGKTTSDAVIGVTRGCMKLLTRDELQGVIAHEFSHILNGDMRLNMKLMGLLFGILVIAMIGQMILRGAGRGARYSSRRGNRDGGDGGSAILFFGIAMMAIGYIGLFFGKLIKAAVSRQREYLADASAVQFTRNPDGLAGALKKIGGLSSGSTIGHPMAEEASHMFFGSAFRSTAFATHPSLIDRIKRLLPSWDGKYGSVELPPITEREEKGHRRQRREKKRRSKQQQRGIPIPIPIPGVSMAHSESSVQMTEAEVIESMSHVHREQLDISHEIHDQLPQHWLKAAHDESGAQGLLFALLVAQDDSRRDAELAVLRDLTDPLTFEAASKFNREVADLHSSVKLAIVDLAIPALRQLSPNEYQRFRDIIMKLMTSDQQINLFEFTLQKVIRRHLDYYFGLSKAPRIKYRKISRLQTEAAILITTIAALGNKGNEGQTKDAFRHGAHQVEGETHATLEFMPSGSCGLEAIETALDRFNEATPLVKQRLLHACGKTVMADGKVTSDEAELIRAVADSIGCPIPPFVKTGLDAAT